MSDWEKSGGFSNPQMYPPNYGGQGQKPDVEQQQQQYQAEAPKPKCNDIIAVIVFLAQFFCFVALSIISMRTLYKSSGNLKESNGKDLTLNLSTAYLLTFVCCCGLVFSLLLLGIAYAFTTVCLEICLLLSVIVSIVNCVYMWITHQWSGAVIYTIIAFFAILSYFPMRHRIPFSKQVLRLVVRISKEYKSTYIIAIIGGLVHTAYSIYWSFAIIAIYQKWSPKGQGAHESGGHASNGAVTGLCVFLVISYYWTSQFLLNYFLVVQAGIYGSWYFTGGKASGITGVVFGAFRRASTYSFGSIATGSLIVAILDLIKATGQMLYDQAKDDGNIAGIIGGVIFNCIMYFIDWAVQFFNRYAYIEIALYGKSYFNAAKDTYRLLKQRGVGALINDCLIGNLWTFGSLGVGALCALLTYAYIQTINPNYISENTNMKAVLLGYAWAIGFFISHTIGYGNLSSGASTIFVGLAEEPQVLADRDPQLFETIRQTYPQVVQGV